MKKILLSTLAVFSLIFTVHANAEEQATNENQTSTQASTSTETTVGQGTTPTKTLADLTKEEFNSIIPDAFAVSVTKTDYANYIVKDDFQSDGSSDIVEQEIKTKLIPILKERLSEKGITISDSDVTVFTSVSHGTGDFDGASIGLGNGKYYKEFVIEYAKESGYNETDETYVRNKVKSIKFDKFDEEGDAIIQVYKIGDEASASKWNYKNYDYSKLVNDSSITVKTTAGSGGMGSGGFSSHGVIMYFFKNNILYDVKYISFVRIYGTKLDNGTPIEMAKLEKEDETYKEMAKELKTKGLTNIIGCYELTAHGTTSKGMKVSFDIGTKYNNRIVQILHKKNDGKFEVFKNVVVKKGKVTITVDSFSPFMIALTNKTAGSSNNAQTSAMNVGLYSSLSLVALLGIIYILKGKKKVA